MNDFILEFPFIHAEVYLEPCQISMMELFCKKIVTNFNPLQSDVAFLCPLNKSENLKVFQSFQEV